MNEFLHGELAIFILREELLKYLSHAILSYVFALKEQKHMVEVPG